MKRLRSFDDVNSASDNRGSSSSRPSSSHRDFHYKSDNCRLGMGSSPYGIRYDRLSEEDREGSRSIRKRVDNVPDSFDRRKGFDRYRGYGADRLYRSSSFCGSRRESPKGYRSDRGHSRQDASVSSLRRFHCSKDQEDDFLSGRGGGGGKGGAEGKGSGWQSRSAVIKTRDQMHTESTSSSEMEEGELEPEPQTDQFQNDSPEHRCDSPEKTTASKSPSLTPFQKAEEKAPDPVVEEADRLIEQACKEVVEEKESGTSPPYLLEDKTGGAGEISRAEPEIIPPTENSNPDDVKSDREHEDTARRSPRRSEHSPAVDPEEEDSTTYPKGKAKDHSDDDDDDDHSDDGGSPLECKILMNAEGGMKSAGGSTDVPAPPTCFETFNAAYRSNPAASIEALELSLSLPNAAETRHNPSCSLTRDSLEIHERSVGSGRVFRGAEVSEPASSPQSRDAGSAVKTLISMIVSEPLHAVSGRFEELPDRTVGFLKERVSELLTDHDGLRAVQKSLRRRPDLTLEGLSNCPRPLLETMTSLRTARKEFLRTDAGVSASSLAEVFLGLRCRNPSCLRRVPTDGCDCGICSRKPGFCSLCMCLLCGNFDAASNTCAWVGCDFCLHWCHADCGLEKNHISGGAAGVQFRCVACGHPSEMYGFVREVFQNFAGTWPLETLSNELQYVRRIFRPSTDVRGKQLRDLADELCGRLDTLSPADIYNPVLFFFSEAKGAGAAERAGVSRWNAELERVVRIKEAEAKMFQARADRATREAHGLKRIADAKSEKMEQEFSSRIAKLHLPETEESRRLKLDQLHTLDRAHLDYLNMKLRMEADIKDLLARMELTKRNLALPSLSHVQYSGEGA